MIQKIQTVSRGEKVCFEEVNDNGKQFSLIFSEAVCDVHDQWAIINDGGF